MTKFLRLTMAQLNATVGDIAGNADLARAAWAEAKAAKADLVALPEMFLTGYQTQDLVAKPAFVADAMVHLMALAKDCADGPALSIGAPLVEEERLYNAYFTLRGGEIVARARKHFLPNFNVFDEVRLFKSADIEGPYAHNNGARIGHPICEDAWYPDVCEAMVESGAEILVVPNGSPYFRDKFPIRMNNMVSRVIENDVPLVYINLVGAQTIRCLMVGRSCLIVAENWQCRCR